MCSIIRVVFSDSVANEVCNVFAFITVSGIVVGILGDHQITKYVIAAQNKQTAIEVLIFAAANLDPLPDTGKMWRPKRGKF